MFDYTSLNALSTVIQEGAFERAARLLHVTPSAISQRIKQLEDRLGCVLVVRGHPCRATVVGELLCRHISQVSLLEQDLHKTLPGLAENEQRATLRVAVHADSLATWVVAAFSAFAERSATLLDAVLEDEDFTLDWLRSGSVRAAVTRQSQPVSGCTLVPLGQLRYRAVASPEFMRRCFPEGVMHKSLTHTPVLRFNSRNLMHLEWMHKFGKRWAWPPTHWLPSTHAFVDAARAGLGWSLSPVSLVQRFLEDGSLVELAPRTDMLVPLYWQVTRLAVPSLMRLTAAITAAAKKELDPSPRSHNRGRRR